MYFLFDIGGTKTRLGIASGGKILKPTILPTPKRMEDGLLAVGAFLKEKSAIGKIKASVGGVAGVLDASKTKLLNSPNLPGWSGKPLKKELERTVKAPARLENDAALAALGEASRGAAKGKNIAVYITVGTGVGGARILDGGIDRGIFEPGHQIIVPSGAVCSCGGRGHLEAYVSGFSIKKHYKKEPGEITDSKIWDEAARFLAYGIHNALVFWSPDIIILGGSMIIKNPGISIEKIKACLLKIAAPFSKLPPVKKAVLGDWGGLYGGLTLIQKNNFQQDGLRGRRRNF